MNNPDTLVAGRQFLSGGGEMCQLMRTKDWSKTSLGPIDSWPQSLKTVLSVCLNSQIPILIWWGKDLVNIYNDALLPMLGEKKHPNALGAKGNVVWVEIWHIVGPMLESVLHEGTSRWSQHQLSLLNRHSHTEERYFTFSYSPIYDESGTIGGVFTTVKETTREVLSAKRLNAVASEIADVRGESERRLAEDLAGIDKSKRPARILIADDNDDMLAYIQNLLHGDFVIETASNGKSALEKIHLTAPDLVITDIMMPVMNGIELLHAVKNDRETESIPVIMLSARVGEEAKIESYDTRADDYLIKPFSAKELVARVNSQIKMARVRNHTERYLRNVFDQAPVRICILKGPEFIIQQANPLMLGYWGKPLDEVLNQPFFNVFPELIEQGFFEILNNVFQKGNRYTAKEVPLDIMRNGQLMNTFASFVYEPFKELDGKVSAVICIGHDVTDLVLARKGAQRNAQDLEQLVSERTADLKKMNEELIVKNTELEQFAFLSSHDLQEPLRKIQTFSGLLTHNIDNREAIIKYVQKIEGSVSRMSGLIKSLLTYSDVAQSKVADVPVDLNLILKLAIEDLELVMAEKKVTIRSESLPTIHGDPRQLGQLFFNLLSNAIKFSVNPPVIEITCKAVPAIERGELNLQPEKGYTKLIFKDNGIGFAPQYAQKIFGIFQRLHNPTEYPGTGIGLALCKKIAEKHLGAITAVSRDGEGSTFNVYLAV